jgi:hypothetical protein
LVQTEEERKAKQKEYNSTPEAKAKRKAYASRPEVKAKVRAYKSTPEAKAKRKATRNKIENKVKEKEYRERPEVKAKALLNSAKPERKAKKKEYSKKYNATYYSTPEAKAKQKEYASTYYSTPESKAKRSTPEYKAYLKKYQKKNDDQRLKILQAYSKRLSNSDVPCCNCCGLNEYLDFLALDHIIGKKQMDSIPELVAIGYSSKLVTKELFSWIIDNNFPDGFQILCHNCNFAKGYPRNNGKCPLENKLH